jgi:arginyl-tRNA synthetase
MELAGGELMQTLREQLSALFGAAFKDSGLDPKFGEVLEAQRPELCQWQCNGALGAAKQAGKNPRQIGQALLDRFAGDPRFAKLELAGPGFLNITLADDALASGLGYLAADRDLACTVGQASRFVLDFGGPNVAKPMHVGHLRSAIIGDCLQRLLKTTGQDVFSFNHLGDWGTQMGMVLVGLGVEAGKDPGGLNLDIERLEDIYRDVSQRCKTDAALLESASQATFALQQGQQPYRKVWEQMVAVSRQRLEQDFRNLGVVFDEWKGESAYQSALPGVVEEFRSRQVAVQGEIQAVIVPLEKDGKEITPLMLRKSDGGFLYATTDLAALKERVFGRKADEVLYVADKRQELHFTQVGLAAEKIGWIKRDQMRHIAFGTMNGKDGKPFKTREGGVMKLKDLQDMVVSEARKKMDEAGVAEGYAEKEKAEVARKVGLAALKFADLSNHRLTDYVFDLDKFTRFEGKTGPYLLYAAVRIKSILRKAREKGFGSGPLLPPGEAERELVLNLLRYPDAVREAAAQYAPNLLCEFLYGLAQAFSRFYTQCHILSEEDEGRRNSWLALSSLCLTELERGLGILGIETPERM